jgi:hypothetical protein
MSKESTPKRKTPWQFQPLPPDHLHPLTFLRPDVVLHVHDLWKSGRHNETTYRTFSLPDATNFRPFVMMGGSDCVHYIESWRQILRDASSLLIASSVLAAFFVADNNAWLSAIDCTALARCCSAVPGTVLTAPVRLLRHT